MSNLNFSLKGFSKQEFNWEKYLKRCGAKAAPEHLFREVGGAKTGKFYRLSNVINFFSKKLNRPHVISCTRRLFFNIRICFLRISRLKFAKFKEYLKNKPETEILKSI